MEREPARDESRLRAGAWAFVPHAALVLAIAGCAAPDYAGEYRGKGEEVVETGLSSAPDHVAHREKRTDVAVSVVPADGAKAYTITVERPDRESISLYVSRSGRTAGGEGISYAARADGVVRRVFVSSVTLSGGRRAPRLRITGSGAVDRDEPVSTTIDLALAPTRR